jgi:hypothetical protein
MKCPAESILQSYLDNELPAEEAKALTAHVCSCVVCDTAISEIKSEMMLLGAVFEQTLFASPPTEHLRARIDAAIATETNQTIGSVKGKTRSLGRFDYWRSSVAAFFARPAHQFAAFTCLTAVLLIGSVFFFMQTPRKTTQVVSNTGDTTSVVNAPDIVNTPPQNRVQKLDTPDDNITSAKGRASHDAILSPLNMKTAQAHLTNRPRVRDIPRTVVIAARYHPSTVKASLPGEQSYLQAIASLSGAIEADHENALPSPARAEYKRNLALVDKAIAATRREARRYPRDTDATEFLLAAYQSKLDLLDTIASASR